MQQKDANYLPHVANVQYSFGRDRMVMDQFRNEVALWVKKLRGRYDAIFIEPENVSKIS
jgi:hypothetical protein